MATLIADAIISHTITYLIDYLASPDLLQFVRREKLRKELKIWEKTLQSLHAVLADAEEKQMSNRFVSIWLGELRDLAYDLEDILDEFSTEVLRQKLQQRKVRRFLSSLNPSTIKFNHEMGRKVKGISARLQEIVGRKNDLELIENGIGGKSSKALKRLPSTSLVEQLQVFGRDNDREAIVKLLLSGGGCDDDDGDEFCVIPIVGMGGLGKTTLAQLVYNDVRVTNCFDLKVWCCVSEDFDVVRVTKTILEAITLASFDVKDLNLLQVRLRERLMGQKFLIVLDDVWNENYDYWTVLRHPFQAGSRGSKIIVTTRNQNVAAMMGSVQSYPLKELLFDDCMSLFAKHALGRSNFDNQPKLKEIGEEIVQRCRGLPLAIKTIGGLLRTKSTSDEWENVLNSKIWDLSELKSGIVPALRLSYYHLPSHLKQLFAFCSIFPKGYEFYQDELVLLWMAEGFLPPSEEKKQMKELHSCFNELLSRSFFQPSSGKDSQFVMHDLINDLAQSVAGETCVNLNDKLEFSKLSPVHDKTRHTSFTRRTYEVWQRFKGLGKMKNLRTFIALPIYTSPWAASCYLSNNVLHELPVELRRLRVLSLSGYCIIELPDSISGLKHLRYLNLSQTKIEKLPESVSSLLNLQTLNLHGCRELTNLPQGTGNLIKLCYLDITDTLELRKMPLWIGNLTGLQKLSKFIVGKDDGNGIRQLKRLKNLQGTLSILGLDNVVDVQHAVDANLMNKHGLVELELTWSDKVHDSQNLEFDMHVLDSLKPHTNLKELKISFYGGKKFPTWIGDPSFAKIVHLKLSHCKMCTSLPPLGRLPLLEDLCIEGMNEVKSVDLEFYGAVPPVKHFPSLKTLKFEDMSKWEQWSSPTILDEEAFPCLLELSLLNCPKLIRKLPSSLPSLEKLTIRKCPILESLLINIPSLKELKLEEHNEVALGRMVNTTSLTTLEIRNMLELTCLQDGFIQSLGALKSLVISNCTMLKFLWQKGSGLESLYSLERIVIKDCPQFVSLREDDCGLSYNLEEAGLLCFRKLEELPYGLLSLVSLKDLYIDSCPKLVSAAKAGLLSSLRRLVLRNCPALESLTDGNHCLLEELEIEDCCSLKCFPRGRLPAMLKVLKIRYCTNLQSLPDGMMHIDNSTNNLPNLEHLEIIGCPSLKFFPAGKLPARLKTIKIWDCSQLEPLSNRMLHEKISLEYVGIWNCTTLTSLPECLHIITHLIELNIGNCSSLKSFPETGMSLPHLRTLNIYSCKKLQSLPFWMQNLTSLQELTICECPYLVLFPRADFPANLTSLEIWDCQNSNEPVSEVNLQSLTSLRELSIAGGCFSDAVSFPDKRFLLPTTLISAWIGKLPKLESLSIQLQSLTSLEELEIVDCPKLRSLPKGGLPPSLGRFSIRDCPYLEQHSVKKKRVHWSMISHIPCIEPDREDT